jgi:hypothetical protein
MNLTLLHHPATYTTGTRVLMLKSRHKDGVVKERAITRITHSELHFLAALTELLKEAQPNERIYGSIGERSMEASIREFKRRQLDADYDDDPERFYRAIHDRWVSCLMAPISQQTKFWLFDCDSEQDAVDAKGQLGLYYDRDFPIYEYRSKSGYHIVTAPFNRKMLSEKVKKLIHTNPLMLWAY